MRCHTGPGTVLVAVIAASVAAGAPAQARRRRPTAAATWPRRPCSRMPVRSSPAGKYAEACPKFADSERLGPSVSTLLNLANCWEKAGRTATAWATYRQAASAAERSRSKGLPGDRAPARRRSRAEAGPRDRDHHAAVPGLEVKRDGVVVESAEWGTGIPVDTGSHSIEASAPGHKAWQVALDVAQDGAQASVTVPALEELPAAPALAATPPRGLRPVARFAVEPREAPAGSAARGGRYATGHRRRRRRARRRRSGDRNGVRLQREEQIQRLHRERPVPDGPQHLRFDGRLRAQ